MNNKKPLSKKQDIKQSIRQRLRLHRQGLTPHVRQQKAQAAMRLIVSHPFFQLSTRVALYWPVDGEMDPRLILGTAWKKHKKCYLPVLHPCKSKHLLFAEYRLNDTLVPNRYKILQPKLSVRKPIPPWHLDIVLVPLVAFDMQGHRLGRGAGYYDRTFEYLHRSVNLRRPKLIGLAYEFQQVDAIPKKSWDIPLAGVVTEKRFITFPDYSSAVSNKEDPASASNPSTRLLA